MRGMTAKALQCFASSPDSMISTMGLHRLSLRFPEAATETAFLRTRTGALLAMFFKCTLLIFVTAALNALLMSFSKVPIPCEPSDELDEISTIQASLNGVWFAWSFAMLVLVKCPAAMRHIGQVQREVALLVFMHGCIIFTILPDFFYMAQLRGVSVEEACPDAIFTDMHVLVVIYSVFTITHSVLPIRWCAVWTVELVGALSYVAMAYGIGSPQKQHRIPNTLFLVCIGLTAGFGKRRSELHERYSFWLWLNEKGLRVQAEHASEAAAAASESMRRPCEDDDVEAASSKASKVESLPSTSVTGQIFKNVDRQNIAGKKEEVSNLGLKEKWLVSASAVTVHRELLGRGTFGIVARGSFQGAPAALKVPTALTRSSEIRTMPMVLNELRILRHVRHPNIVLFNGICFAGDEGSSLVLVFELVHGVTMDSWILHKTSPPSDGDRYAGLMGVCCALRYLHSMAPRVVHGDLKAKNIMVEYRGASAHAKLLDFGCSRVITQGARPLGGTMLWKAPEVVKGFPERPLVSSDVFSFGCLMYFVMTGTLPLSGLSYNKVRSTLFGLRLPSLAWPQNARLLVSGSEELVERCLHFEISQRLDMDGVYADLATWSERGGFASGAGSGPASSETEMDLKTGVAWVRQALKAKGKAAGAAEDKQDANAVNIPRIMGRVPFGKPTAQGTSGGSSFRVESCQLSVPLYLPTPSETQWYSLLSAMQPWNVPVPPGTCCGYHAAVQALKGLYDVIKDEPCKTTWHNNVEAQCTKCGALIMNIDHDNSELECPVCFTEHRVKETMVSADESANDRPADPQRVAL